MHLHSAGAVSGLFYLIPASLKCRNFCFQFPILILAAAGAIHSIGYLKGHGGERSGFYRFFYTLTAHHRAYCRTIGHTLTFCHALEGLCGIPVDKGSRRLRAAALELERLAKHIGDLGALAGDVAYLPTSSFCGRIRGEYLNTTAELCCNRFGRNLVVPGGCAYTLDKERISRILAKLKKTWKELQHALNLMFDSPTVLDRLENTGTVTKENLVQIGAVGPAARAGGIQADARQDLPVAEYENCPPCPGVQGKFR